MLLLSERDQSPRWSADDDDGEEEEEKYMLEQHDRQVRVYHIEPVDE